MYDKLVKALRGCVLSKPCDGCPYYDPNGPTEQCATMNIAAADAIETLSMKLHGDEAAIVGMKREIERMVVAGKPRWIPVSERLPEKSGSYLVYVYGDVTNLNYWRGKWHWLGDDYTQAVTHWMPMPEPPKEEK